MGSSRRRLLNQSTHFKVSISTSSMVRHDVRRRLNKVMLPALKALSEDRAFVEIRMTSKQAARTVAVRDLIAELRNPDRAGALMGTGTAIVASQAQKAAQVLQDLINMGPGPERQQAAAEYMRGDYANKTYILG